MKLHDFGASPTGGRTLVFHCPGCGYDHPWKMAVEQINEISHVHAVPSSKRAPPAVTLPFLCHRRKDRVLVQLSPCAGRTDG